MRSLEQTNRPRITAKNVPTGTLAEIGQQADLAVAVWRR